MVIMVLLLLLFQSTLPREERQKENNNINIITYFNPRSHERSDRLIRLPIRINQLFQSTLPREERPIRYIPLFKSITKISIHAPTRGATVKRTPSLFFSAFQSTLPREERPCVSSGVMSRAKQFQSTLPREERRCRCGLYVGCKYFNPRSHERSDDRPS